jgi:hypothetical protein
LLLIDNKDWCFTFSIIRYSRLQITVKSWLNCCFEKISLSFNIWLHLLDHFCLTLARMSFPFLFMYFCFSIMQVNQVSVTWFLWNQSLNCWHNKSNQASINVISLILFLFLSEQCTDACYTWITWNDRIQFLHFLWQ